MNTPTISVIIATYNSSDRIHTLKETLDKQVDEHGQPWGDRLQVLCVDGGSTDATRELALEAQWSVLDNPAGDPVSAKVIGWEAATSDFIVFVDHDEVLLNNKSLARKFDQLKRNAQIVASFSSGYLLDELDAASSYLSEFGDAFSSFAYRTRNSSTGDLPRATGLVRIMEDGEGAVLRPPRGGSRALVEIAVQGTMVSRTRLRKATGLSTSDGSTLLRGAGVTDLADWAQIGILKDDPVGHDPRASWSSIRAKGRWRLHNNLRITMASGGAFRSREGHQTTILVAFLYALHVVTIFPLVARATVISVRSRKNYFFGHVFLSFALLFDAFAVLLRTEQGRYGS